MAILQIRLFGVGQIRDGAGKVVSVRSRKELAALAYLLVEGAQSHSREVLQNLFWPDLDMASGRNNLRVTLAHLQGIMPAGPNGAAGAETARLLHASRSEVQFNRASQVWVDVSEFQRLIDDTQRHDHASRSGCAHCYQLLHTAVALYAAEFLSGFALADCPAFEEWLFLQRERQHLLVLKAYQDLGTYAEQQGELETALTFVQRQIAIDPLREAAYRQQMYILARQGERNLALAAFERCRAVISDELGIDPEPETLLLHQQILSDQIVPQPKPASTVAPSQPETPFVQPASTSPPLTSAVATETRPTRHNLPQPLTAFIGREPEVAQLQERLATGGSRLISLVGPGGIGKTRLAIHVGGASQHLFPDGVFFVALAGVQAVAAIPAAILGAMNADLAGSAAPTTQLLQFLARQKLLLVIDNLEHLLDGVDLLLTILQAAPGVTLLVTTREQLNCQAEDCFILSGLATPAQSNLAEAGQYAAVRLFCECAYRLHKNFKLTAENCPAVVNICQLVAGMPLALELATTWLGDLDCAGLAAAIAKNQAILATTQRDRPARHRSMQAVFDYSWQMLTAREQQLLGQLALCQGRFSASIATQLTGASLIDLTGLRYKSLLRIAEVGYYDLHPLIRAFALATLDSSIQRQAEERVATLYLQQVAAQAVALSGATPQAALQVIERELDNVQQAWHWAATNMRSDLLLQSVDALGEYYSASGRNAECETSFLPLLQRLLARKPAIDDPCFALSLHLLDKGCGALVLQSKYADVLLWGERLVELAQMAQNREYEARGLYHLGCALNDGKMLAARQKLEGALSLARQVEQPRLLGSILLELGITYLADSGSQVATYLQEALTIQRSLGNRTAEQRILLYLGINCTYMEEYEAGRAYQLAALNLLNVTGNRPLEMRIVGGLGFTLSMLGDYPAALEYLVRARRISQEIGWRRQESYALHNLCSLQRKLGNLDLAVEYGKESLRIALQLDSEDAANYARFHLGYALLARGDLEQALQTFQQAQDSWHAGSGLKPTGRKQAGWATMGMAAALFHQGNLTEATTLIASFVPSLLEQVPWGEEVYEMYLTSHAILMANGDTRTGKLLTTAYTKLQQNASKLTDRHLLHCFWDAPAHRKIRELWRALPG
jgi:predicted ATPase/DNA-binding SARP family transcriptional activator